jgi:hypothetical protein
MRKKICAVALCILAVVLQTTSVFADGEGGKGYSGYQCRETVPNTIYYTWGGALNKSSQTVRVICPIIRDAGWIGGGWIRFVDQIYNDSPDGSDGKTDIACYLRSYARVSGRTFQEDYGVKRITSYAAFFPPPGVRQDHTITKEFGRFPFFGDKYDTYFLDCYIPGTRNGKMSGIVSFYIHEDS